MWHFTNYVLLLVCTTNKVLIVILMVFKRGNILFVACAFSHDTSQIETIVQPDLLPGVGSSSLIRF